MSHTNIQCVITGITVIDIEHSIAWRGDLFHENKLWIVNCNETPEYSYVRPFSLPTDRSILWFGNGAVKFERRNVFVFTSDTYSWGLNDFAKAYIQRNT